MSELQQKMEAAMEAGASLDEIRALMHSPEQRSQVDALKVSSPSADAPYAPKSNPIADMEVAGVPVEEVEERPEEVAAEVPTEEIDITLPSGEDVTVTVPQGLSDEEVLFRIRDVGELATNWENFSYEFSQGSNITSNLGDYLKSHFPYLTTTYTLNADGEIEIKFPEDIYGSEIDSMSPQERREHMKQVDTQMLQDRLSNVNPEKTGKMGVAGSLTKAVADPALLVPGGAAIRGAESTYQAGVAAAKVGGVWGGAYGASEQLSEAGVPSSIPELKSMGKKVGTGAAAGVAGGAVLGPVGYQAIKTFPKVRAKNAFRSPQKAEKFAKEQYYPEMWRAQAGGKTSSEAQNHVRKKFGLSMDQEWQIAKSSPQTLWKPSGAFNEQVFWTSAYSQEDAIIRMSTAKLFKHGDPVLASKGMQMFDNLIRPLASALRDVHPKTASRLVRMESDILRKIHVYHNEMRPFIDQYRKFSSVGSGISKEDRYQLGMALYNGNFKKARELMVQMGGDEAGRSFYRMISGLKDLGKEMRKVGIEFDFIDHYFPRIIKDVRGLKKALGTDKQTRGLQKFLEAEAKKAGGSLSDVDEIKLINRWMQSGKAGKYKSVKSAKTRKVREITRDIIEFYDDPITSIDLHLRDSVSAMERRRFFGKEIEVNESGIENIKNSVGNLITKYKMSGEVSERVKELLVSRFSGGEAYGSKWAATARQGVGGFTLGNPYSAVRQLGDIPVVAVRYGLIDTLKSMPSSVVNTIKGQLGITSKHGLDPDSFGYMMEMAQEMDTGGIASNLIKRTSNRLYRYGGFKTIDRLGKNVLMQTIIRKHMRMSRSYKGREKLTQEFGSVYEADELLQLTDDLSKGKVTDLVKAHVSAEVMSIQPISRSQMPKAYLDHPNGRMFYQFRTWGIRQLDMARQEVWRNLTSGDPTRVAQGAKAAALFYLYVGASNVGITEVQRLMTGRDGKLGSFEDLPDESLWALLGNFTINRYSMEKMAEQGEFEAFWQMFKPPALEIPANMGLSIPKIVMAESEEEKNKWSRNLLKETGIGRLIDFWFLGGAEEANAKQQKEKDTEFNKRYGF